jgi:hypothetical protein
MEQTLSPDMLLNFFQEIKDLYKETDRKFQETQKWVKERSAEEAGEGVYKLFSAISATFIRYFINPILSGLFPWTGTDTRAGFPGFV